MYHNLIIFINSTMNIFKSISNVASVAYTELLYLTCYWKNIPKYKGLYAQFPNTTDSNVTAVMIMLHGMNSNSGQFAQHIDKIVEYNVYHNDCIRMFVPEIRNRGMDTVEKCGEDVYSSISDKLDDIVRKGIRVFILGISNGGRIGLYLYNKIMDKYNYDKLYLSTLGSPLRGTRVANLAIQTGLYVATLYRNNPNVLNELSYESETSLDLIKKCSKHTFFPNNTKFYSSNCDIMITPPSAGTIEDHKNNTLVDGIGHNGLIIYCHQDQLSWCFDVMTSTNQDCTN
jgi:hypothetical protein